jgi:hypothetical protein
LSLDFYNAGINRCGKLGLTRRALAQAKSVIEREIPGVGKMSAAGFRQVARKSVGRTQDGNQNRKSGPKPAFFICNDDATA